MQKERSKFPLRCWAEIDLAAIGNNVANLRTRLPQGAVYVSVIKADAYGHGLGKVAAGLAESGVDQFAVANLAEAAVVRSVDRKRPILMIGPALREEDDLLAEYDVTPTISSMEEVERFEAAAKKAGRTIPVQLKIDTGMGRLGVWHEGAAAVYGSLTEASHLRLCGVYTHLASAESDPAFTEHQRELFLRVLGALPGLAPAGLLLHSDNSAGLDSIRGDRGFNAARVGLAQYGVRPGNGERPLLSGIELTPAFGFHARVALIKHLPAGTTISYGRTRRLDRDARVAVLCAGYGDGIPFAAGNRASVLIRGSRCPVLGRVTMDEVVVDVTEADGVCPGDRATFWGRQGDAEITVHEVAGWADTIPYEILCAVTKRVPRVYVS